MTAQPSPPHQPGSDDELLAVVTAILKEVVAALSLLKVDPKLQTLFPFLEAARDEAKRLKALHTPKPS